MVELPQQFAHCAVNEKTGETRHVSAPRERRPKWLTA
jgi:hypothetical protein